MKLPFMKSGIKTKAILSNKKTVNTSFNLYLKGESKINFVEESVSYEFPRLT